MYRGYGIWQAEVTNGDSDQKQSGAYFEQFNFKYLNSHIKQIDKDCAENSDTDTSNSRKYKTPNSKYKYIFQMMNSPSEKKVTESLPKPMKPVPKERSNRKCARQLLDSFDSVKQGSERNPTQPIAQPKVAVKAQELHPLLKFFSREIKKSDDGKKPVMAIGECINPALKRHLHQNILKKLLDL